MAAATLARGTRGAAYTYGYWPTKDLDGYHWHYGDGLSAGVIPTNDGLACMFVGGPPGGLPRGPAVRRPVEAQHAMLGRLEGRLADLVAPHQGPGANLPRDAGPAATCVRGPAGRWSGTPVGGKTRCPPTGSPRPCADAEPLAAAVVAGAAAARAAEVALAGYQAQRDRVARPWTRSSTASPRTGGISRGPPAAPRAVLGDGGRGGNAGRRRPIARGNGLRDPRVAGGVQH